VTNGRATECHYCGSRAALGGWRTNTCRRRMSPASFGRQLWRGPYAERDPSWGLIGDSFTHEAWTLGRKVGVVFTTPSLFFGSQIQEALAALISALTNVASTAKSRPEIVSTLFEQLGRIEGASANLRGPPYELIVAQAVGQGEAGRLRSASSDSNRARNRSSLPMDA
jgi:hypothetical protein